MTTQYYADIVFGARQVQWDYLLKRLLDGSEAGGEHYDKYNLIFILNIWHHSVPVATSASD